MGLHHHNVQYYHYLAKCHAYRFLFILFIVVNEEPAATLEPGSSTVNFNTNATIVKQTQTRIFKIIVIGDSNVGKTCLTFRFCAGRFPDKTEATIGVDFREKLIDIDGEAIKVTK